MQFSTYLSFVEIAAIHVSDKVDIWLSGVMFQSPRITWKEFGAALCARFGEKMGMQVIDEFNKLEQKGNLEEYTEKFEEKLLWWP